MKRREYPTGIIYRSKVFKSEYPMRHTMQKSGFLAKKEGSSGNTVGKNGRGNEFVALWNNG
ncbi:MAG: hypothetical protein AB1742_06710 [bacterium]